MFRSVLCRRLKNPISYLHILPRNSFHGSAFQNAVLLFEREHKIKSFGMKPAFLEPQHHIYKVVGRELGPKELTVILTQDSLEYGVAGEVVTLPKRESRKLIRDFKAVYASPENLEEHASSLASKSAQSTQARKLKLWLDSMEILKCPMYEDVKWTMTPTVAARALQRTHKLIISEDALELPNYPIESSSAESWGEHEIKITVNKIDTVTKKMDIVPWILSKKTLGASRR